MFKTKSFFVLILASAALSGCETLSDPAFLEAMQNANSQLSQTTQTLGDLHSCVRSAPNAASVNSCTQRYVGAVTAQ